MTCPRCGFEQPEGLPECGRCGVIFAKLAAAWSRRAAGHLNEAPLQAPPSSGAVAAAAAVPLTPAGAMAAPGAPRAHELPAGAPSNAGIASPADRELLHALAIGGAVALVFQFIGPLRFVFSYLVTLVHEMGHCVTDWIFGYPAVPAFDFMHGGGVTINQGRHPGVVALLLAGFGLAIYQARRHRRLLVALGILAGLYCLASFTRIHEILQLAMGHGMELILAGVFLYRALSGEKIHVPAERHAYAFAGFFILFSDIGFAWGLLTSHQRRVEYELAKGGGAWMDFSRIATEYLDTDLTRVAGFFLVCSLALPVLTWLIYRNRERLRSKLESLFTA